MVSLSLGSSGIVLHCCGGCSNTIGDKKITYLTLFQTNSFR